jgi:hypothetical protein
MLQQRHNAFGVAYEELLDIIDVTGSHDHNGLAVWVDVYARNWRRKKLKQNASIRSKGATVWREASVPQRYKNNLGRLFRSDFVK